MQKKAASSIRKQLRSAYPNPNGRAFLQNHGKQRIAFVKQLESQLRCKINREQRRDKQIHIENHKQTNCSAFFERTSHPGSCLDKCKEIVYKSGINVECKSLLRPSHHDGQTAQLAFDKWTNISEYLCDVCYTWNNICAIFCLFAVAPIRNIFPRMLSVDSVWMRDECDAMIHAASCLWNIIARLYTAMYNNPVNRRIHWPHGVELATWRFSCWCTVLDALRACVCCGFRGR